MYKYTPILMLLFLFFSCKSVEYVKVPEYHYETINKTDTFVERDSVYYHDSVYVVKSGDTITTYKTKIVYKDRWREIVKIDSFIKTDSIRVPYPVEKKLTKWQQMKMNTGGVALVLCVVIVFFILLKLIFARRII